ncbi:ORF6N domain-containing protein [Parabacteroides faecis]|uniref:Phage regulator Rha-like protein n=1 Tax=Parabacteroides faecis TaxID=1217282 RepID=A0ABR6KG08_9BACT|nr:MULTISPECIES: ORF6N domain-containing protein [Parabacteroides]MBB4620436.1 phage regulator Rha-like protein [Parabacteroides faecis]MBC8616611.1 ORF6N domain-containing protein [Parabacteroides faecis]RHR94108.1 ORF6N domain-containing protein [Parabacteroides sp. AF14-59]UVQ45031.1 ORF6N domain-containing protein [Parabacteroides faecis]GGJ97460.1 DNA-binding protein [Parabacteroides faecis]
MELRLIQNKIYEIRGQKVMLDFDLAEIYGIETKYLKRSVKRNIERFEGEDFMFELTKEELSRCNFGTLNNQRGSNVKYMPFAFSELGVAMLSSVLKSKTAIEINRGIIRVFVAMRHLVLNPPADKVVELQQEVKNLKEYIEEVFSDYNDINDDTRMQLELINQTLAELQSQKKIRNKLRNPVGFVKPDPDIL